MLLYWYYILQKLPLYPYSYSLCVSVQLYLRQRWQFHYSLFTAIVVTPEWQYTYDGVSCRKRESEECLLYMMPSLQNWTQESISTRKRSVHDHSIIDIFLSSLNLLIFVPVLQKVKSDVSVPKFSRDDLTLHHPQSQWVNREQLSLFRLLGAVSEIWQRWNQQSQM